MQERRIANGFILDDGRGCARITVVHPGVIELTYEGVIARPFGERHVPFAEKELSRHGSLVLLVDTWDQKSTDTGNREIWTRWLQSHRGRVHSHVLVRSRLVDMAVSVLSLLVGVGAVTSCSSIAAFEKVGSKHAPGFVRRAVSEVHSTANPHIA